MPTAASATPEPTSSTSDRIDWIRLSLVFLPLAEPVSDAKVLTGRQKPLTEVAFVFAEIRSRDGHEGIGFAYSKRAGGPGLYAHAKEIAPNLLGEDPNDIAKAWNKLMWAGASMGRSGMTSQAIAPFDIALWDMKAKRAQLPLAKLLGAHRDSVQCYNTSGGFLHTPLDRVLANVEAARASGIGGIKIKVGQLDAASDLKRVAAVRDLLGDGFPLMVDANQQWDRPAAQRACRALEQFNLVWIEEPLDAYDVEGHAALAASLDTPIATGEMLTSFGEHAQLIMADASDYVQPADHAAGGLQGPQTGAAFRDGNPPASGGRLSAGALAGTLRMAGAAVQRAARPARWAHAFVQPPRAGVFAQRAGACMDGGQGGVRQAAVRGNASQLR
jgi:L-alanine-DL-glutamate epimerase-like enolase superfamily enzyme